MYNNMENDELKTFLIKEEILKCEDVEDLKQQILPLLKHQQEQWTSKIHQIIEENGYTKTKFAQLCGVSRVSVDKWCKGSIPRNREMFLRIGMAAGYDLEQMNQLLQRYGQYPALYSKSLEDCICMYVLNGNFGTGAIDKYKYILERIKDNLVRNQDDGTAQNISTAKFDEKLSEVKDDDALEQFITDNIMLFSMAYRKFYAHVKMCIETYYSGYSSTVYEMAEGQGWSSSLRQCVSAIYQNKWYPTRNKIISLGIHLGMEQDDINQMLILAHMEPLCPKNIFESIIIFILEDASLNDIMNEDSDDYDPDGLCRYTKEILEEFDLPEVDLFLSEVSEIDYEW